MIASRLAPATGDAVWLASFAGGGVGGGGTGGGVLGGVAVGAHASVVQNTTSPRHTMSPLDQA